MATVKKIREDIMHAFEIYNTRNMDLIGQWYDEFLTPDCVYHSPNNRVVPGRESIKQLVRGLYEAIPDLHHNLPDELIVQGNKVAIRYTVCRTDPSTGKRQTCMLLLIEHYVGEKVAEMWELISPWQDET